MSRARGQHSRAALRKLVLAIFSINGILWCASAEAGGTTPAAHLSSAPGQEHLGQGAPVPNAGGFAENSTRDALELTKPGQVDPCNAASTLGRAVGQPALPGPVNYFPAGCLPKVVYGHAILEGSSNSSSLAYWGWSQTTVAPDATLELSSLLISIPAVSMRPDLSLQLQGMDVLGSGQVKLRNSQLALSSCESLGAIWSILCTSEFSGAYMGSVLNIHSWRTSSMEVQNTQLLCGIAADISMVASMPPAGIRSCSVSMVEDGSGLLSVTAQQLAQGWAEASVFLAANITMPEPMASAQLVVPSGKLATWSALPSAPGPTSINWDLQSDAITVQPGARLQLRGLELVNIPIEPLREFPAGVMQWNMFSVSQPNLTSGQPRVRGVDCTIVIGQQAYEFFAYILTLYSSPEPTVRQRAGWFRQMAANMNLAIGDNPTSGTGSWNTRRAAWSDCRLQPSSQVFPVRPAYSGFTELSDLPDITGTDSDPTKKILIVFNARDLKAALSSAQERESLLVVSNITLPEDWPAEGVPVSANISVLGLPGIPTVVDMRQRRNAIRILPGGSLVIAYLQLQNLPAEVLPPPAPESWTPPTDGQQLRALASGLWALQMGRPRISVRLVSVTLVCPEEEVELLGNLSRGVALSLYPDPGLLEAASWFMMRSEVAPEASMGRSHFRSFEMPGLVGTHVTLTAHGSVFPLMPPQVNYTAWAKQPHPAPWGGPAGGAHNGPVVRGPASSSRDSHGHMQTVGIVAGTVGAAAALLFVLAAVLFVARRRLAHGRKEGVEDGQGAWPAGKGGASKQAEPRCMASLLPVSMRRTPPSSGPLPSSDPGALPSSEGGRISIQTGSTGGGKYDNLSSSIFDMQPVSHSGEHTRPHNMLTLQQPAKAAQLAQERAQERENGSKLARAVEKVLLSPGLGRSRLSEGTDSWASPAPASTTDQDVHSQQLDASSSLCGKPGFVAGLGEVLQRKPRSLGARIQSMFTSTSSKAAGKLVLMLGGSAPNSHAGVGPLNSQAGPGQAQASARPLHASYAGRDGSVGRRRCPVIPQSHNSGPSPAALAELENHPILSLAGMVRHSLMDKGNSSVATSSDTREQSKHSLRLAVAGASARDSQQSIRFLGGAHDSNSMTNLYVSLPGPGTPGLASHAPCTFTSQANSIAGGLAALASTNASQSTNAVMTMALQSGEGADRDQFSTLEKDCISAMERDRSSGTAVPRVTLVTSPLGWSSPSQAGKQPLLSAQQHHAVMEVARLSGTGPPMFHVPGSCSASQAGRASVGNLLSGLASEAPGGESARLDTVTSMGMFGSQPWSALRALNSDDSFDQPPRDFDGHGDRMAQEELAALIAQLTNELKDEELSILDVLGSGAFGVVYLGRWRGMQVAVKTLIFRDRGRASAMGAVDTARARCLNEAAICTALNHPHVVSTYAHSIKMVSVDTGQVLRRPLSSPGEEQAQQQQCQQGQLQEGNQTEPSLAALVSGQSALAQDGPLSNRDGHRGGYLDSTEQAESGAAAYLGGPASYPPGGSTSEGMPTSSVDEQLIQSGVTDWKLYIIQEYCSLGTLRELIDKRAPLFYVPGSEASSRRASRMTGLNSRTFNIGQDSGDQPMSPMARASSRPSSMRQAGVLEPWDLSKALDLALQVARGLAHVHSKSIVHSDLNPSNVLLTLSDASKNGVAAKIGDFGLSVRLQPGQTCAPNHFHGTPWYAGPEVQTAGQLGPAADVYSFGVVLWELTHGTPPWRASRSRRRALMEARRSVAAAAMAVTKGQSGLLGSQAAAVLSTSMPRMAHTVLTVSPACPAPLASIITACLSEDPEARPKTAELVSRLVAISRQTAVEIAAAARARLSSHFPTMGLLNRAQTQPRPRSMPLEHEASVPGQGSVNGRKIDSDPTEAPTM